MYSGELIFIDPFPVCRQTFEQFGLIGLSYHQLFLSKIVTSHLKMQITFKEFGVGPR